MANLDFIVIGERISFRDWNWELREILPTLIKIVKQIEIAKWDGGELALYQGTPGLGKGGGRLGIFFPEFLGWGRVVGLLLLGRAEPGRIRDGCMVVGLL